MSQQAQVYRLVNEAKMNKHGQPCLISEFWAPSDKSAGIIARAILKEFKKAGASVQGSMHRVEEDNGSKPKAEPKAQLVECPRCKKMVAKSTINKPTIGGCTECVPF